MNVVISFGLDCEILHLRQKHDIPPQVRFVVQNMNDGCVSCEVIFCFCIKFLNYVRFFAYHSKRSLKLEFVRT